MKRLAEKALLIPARGRTSRLLYRPLLRLHPHISAWWPGRAWPRNSHCPFIPTCCGTCGFKLANDGHDTRAIQAYLGHR